MGFEFYILLGFFVVLFSLGLVGMVLSIRYEHTPLAPTQKIEGNPEAGNIFFAIFGALALVGILGAATMTFMKGPLSSAIKLTKLNTAEVQMTIGSQVAVMSTTSQANSGDCDSDGFVEPMDWRAATTEPVPTNGGLIPLSLGISKKDPWGTEYGYCVWNHGAMTSGGTCGSNMLTGTNSTAYPVVALVSAGPDKAFTTTCRSFATADSNSDGDLDDAGDSPLVSKAAETDDDVIHTFTYEEATAASGGLWSLKSGDPATAVIDKKIETTGTASLAGGVLLPNSALITCDATTAGVMAKNASGTGIEICDGSGSWTSISGGSGASSSFATSTATCDSTTAGQVRYNSTSGNPEFCNGTAWLPFTINVPGVNLVISPSSSSTMNVDGSTNADSATCTVASGMYCGAAITFTVTNQGTATSAALVWKIDQVIGGVTNTINLTTAIAATNATNFVVTSNTCSGATLAPNATCAVIIRPKANGNTTYTGTFYLTNNNAPLAIMQGTSTNFGCLAGRSGGGGKYAACGLSSTEGTYNLIVQPGGCTGSITNPTCAGGTDTVTRAWTSVWNATYAPRASYEYMLSSGNGAQNSVNAMQFYSLAPGWVDYSAIKYCDDMVYGGYSDWYLPSSGEFASYIYPNRTAIGGFAATTYQTSTFQDQTYSYYTYFSTSSGSSNPGNYYESRMVRCARRDNVPLPPATADVDPDGVSITPTVSFSSGGTATSNTVTVSGILQTISVSMTGGTGMNIIKNGVPTGSSSISGVKPSDTLAFQMNAPTTLGTKNTATITIGTDTYSWWVGYADSSKTARIFVTSSTSQGYLNGIAGADSFCNAAAGSSTLGLPSSWKAVISDEVVNAIDRTPWNWGSLTRVDGAQVATSLSDLFDGTIQNPININQNGGVTTNNVWTGSDLNGLKVAGYTINSWTTIDQYKPGIFGNSGNTTSAWTNAGNITPSWGPAFSVYCIEDIDSTAVDTTPAALSLKYAIQVPLSSRQSSNSITIGGMSSGATATLSVSATAGDPKFTVNGGSEVSSASVSNGDVIVFKMDAPASGNSNNKMTITVNGSTTLGYWRVWTGDTTGSAVKRVFVYNKGTSWNGNMGALATADTNCTSAASAAGLGGTWKAIISGQNESEYAVNRIGYDWTTLRRTDGVDVVLAGNIWSTATTPLLNPITKDAGNSNTYSTSWVFTNTDSYGNAVNTSNSGTCNNWTWNGYVELWYAWTGTSGVTNDYWIRNSGVGTGARCDNGYNAGMYYYCIEQ